MKKLTDHGTGMKSIVRNALKRKLLKFRREMNRARNKADWAEDKVFYTMHTLDRLADLAADYHIRTKAERLLEEWRMKP